MCGFYELCVYHKTFCIVYAFTGRKGKNFIIGVKGNLAESLYLASCLHFLGKFQKLVAAGKLCFYIIIFGWDDIYRKDLPYGLVIKGVQPYYMI